LDIRAPIVEPHRNPWRRRPINRRARALQRQEQSREEDSGSSGGMDGKGMGMGRVLWESADGAIDSQGEAAAA